MNQPVESTHLIVGVGYLGTRVADLWRGVCVRPWGTTRKADRCETLAAAGLEPVLWDTLVPGGSLPPAETVLFCVGHDRAAGHGVRAATVDGLRNTLERLSQTRDFLYVSTTGVYGDHGGEWIDESTAPAPLDESGSAHLEAEEELLRWARRRGVRAMILRLAGIYGPNRLIGAAALRAGRPIEADPDVHLNLIHVEDAARAVEAARRHGRANERYIIADGQPPTRRAFYEHLAELLKTRAPSFRPDGARRRRGDRRFAARKMRTELGFTPGYPDFRAGLAASLRAGPASA